MIIMHEREIKDKMNRLVKGEAAEEEGQAEGRQRREMMEEYRNRLSRDEEKDLGKGFASKPQPSGSNLKSMGDIKKREMELLKELDQLRSLKKEPGFS